MLFFLFCCGQFFSSSSAQFTFDIWCLWIHSLQCFSQITFKLGKLMLLSRMLYFCSQSMVVNSQRMKIIVFQKILWSSLSCIARRSHLYSLFFTRKDPVPCHILLRSSHEHQNTRSIWWDSIPKDVGKNCNTVSVSSCCLMLVGLLYYLCFEFVVLFSEGVLWLPGFFHLVCFGIYKPKPCCGWANLPICTNLYFACWI